MSGHVGGLSPEQEDALHSFREAVEHIANKPEDNDYYYLRWLRARKFDVGKSVEMFRNHMDTRMKYDLDNIIDGWTPPEVITKFYPGGFFGEDRDGHPVCYDKIGQVDLRGLYYAVKREDIIKSKLRQLEKRAQIARDFSRKKGRVIETMTLILDFEGLTLHRALFWPGLDIVRELIQLAELNSPETSKTTLIIRAPYIFPMLFNIVKPMMAESTRQKINVLGCNWQEELQTYISPYNLPQAYGGTRCEPDPWCSDYINPGSDIPTEYYFTNLTESRKESMERTVVERGDSYDVAVEVTQLRTILKWEFLSVNYNIKFGIFCESNDRRFEVLPVVKRDCHIIPESGTHICHTLGTYVFQFDNTFSWTRSKELFYSIELLPPTTTSSGYSLYSHLGSATGTSNAQSL